MMATATTFTQSLRLDLDTPKLKRLLRNGNLIAGGSVFVVLALVAIVGPAVYGVDPYALDTTERLAAPGGAHPFGTDTFGRDILSRILKGGQTSLLIGAAVAAITAVLGTLLGLLAAFGKWFDAVSMRIMDGIMAFPGLLFAITIAAAFGAGALTVICALSIVFIPYVARVVRSAAMHVKEMAYIEAMRVQGASKTRIVFGSVLPNVVSPLIVQSTFIFADTLLVEASLSFIGAGVPAPEPSWGNMLLEGRGVIYTGWWAVVFPGLAIMLTILSINVMGDGLRDHFDPHQKFVRRQSIMRHMTRRANASA